MNRFQNIQRLSGLVLAAVLITGCGQRAMSPHEQAQEMFWDGQFDQALQHIDQVLADANSVDREQHSSLLTLKGRCFWEQSDEAYRMKQTELQGELLRRAHDALTESITMSDSAEARHVRSLVLEQMGRKEDAIEDQLKWRELDTEFGTAYLNERPEKQLDSLLKDPSDDHDAITADDRHTIPKQRATEEESISASTDESTASEPRNPITYRQRRDAAGDPEDKSRDESAPNGSPSLANKSLTPTDEEQTDADRDRTDASEDPDDQERPRRLTAPAQRAPGTQFLSPTFLPRPGFSFQPDSQFTPAPTGITGRSRDASYPVTGLGAAPTTGITLPGPSDAESNSLSVPATGIGAAPPDQGTLGPVAGNQFGTGLGGFVPPNLRPGFAPPSERSPAAKDAQPRQTPSGIMTGLHPLLRNQPNNGLPIPFTGARCHKTFARQRGHRSEMHRHRSISRAVLTTTRCTQIQRWTQASFERIQRDRKA